MINLIIWDENINIYYYKMSTTDVWTKIWESICCWRCGCGCGSCRTWGSPVSRHSDLPSAMGRSLASRSNPSMGVHAPYITVNPLYVHNNILSAIHTHPIIQLPDYGPNAPSSHPNWSCEGRFSSIFNILKPNRLLDSKTLNSQLNPNLLCSAVELQRGSVTTMLCWKIFSPII